MLDFAPRRLSRASSIHGLGSRFFRSLWIAQKRFHSKASNPTGLVLLFRILLKGMKDKFVGREGFEPSKT
ncbi:hypothetical protein CH380_07955 [Leptospira adleri]|uniref:Uncharacterized protein n=1 Tax=Leptospira adleri TaxID=2023186 RepID=A0A2M9YQV5_9LEPT|nr:hypothetical protein CH380_07955 [Leptospira adleri]PJZ62014.1 hypothetical protein CH376_10160 [Leptospira adleri]